MNKNLGFATVAVPESWSDNTTFQFTSPVDDSLQTPLMAGRAGGSSLNSSRSNIVISRVPADPAKLADVVSAQRESFKQNLPGVRIVDDGTKSHASAGDVPVLHIQFPASPELTVAQQHAFFADSARNQVVTLTYTCEASNMQKKESEFMELFNSFELESA